MAKNKVIAVVGATGAQGGGLVQAILNDAEGSYLARALTRNEGSDKAQALAQQGAEVVQADLDDVESLKQAFAGADAAYCVTNFWEHFSPEKELAQAQNLVDAAKDAGLDHVIWSTLEDTRQWVPLSDDRMPTLMEKYKVPHFDAKGEANHLFTDAGIPTTFLLTSFYWDNLIYFGMGPKPGQDGKLYITLPMDDQPLPGIGAEDIGKCAYGIFKAGSEYVGKTVGIAGAHLTGAQMATALTQALGKEVGYQTVSPDVYRGFGFPGAEDLGNMFQIKRDFNAQFCGPRSLDVSRALNPSLMNFDQWLAKYKDQMPLDA
jgi:uncharacterized protein YbjT (DUF2867 family)